MMAIPVLYRNLTLHREVHQYLFFLQSKSIKSRDTENPYTLRNEILPPNLLTHNIFITLLPTMGTVVENLTIQLFKVALAAAMTI